MILAAGLTPAWQQTYLLPTLRVGEVNRAVESARCASGKVLNVGSALHHLGASSTTLCPVGGSTGAQIRADFATLEIPAVWLEVAGITRTCTTVLDRTTGATTELVENTAAFTDQELEQYAVEFERLAHTAEMVVLSGSLPALTPPDYYARLMSQTSDPVLLDARGPELKACLPLRPWLVKPNREELSATVGRPLVSTDDLIAAMHELQAAGAMHVIVSDGAGGLLAADAHGVEHYPSLKVPVVNPIGCGDCLTAGIALAASEGRPWKEVVEFGIATAAENASRLLPARFSRASVEQHLVRRA